MKVTQDSPKKMFDPITVVLETEDEAMLLWASLNVNTRIVFDEGGVGLALPECRESLDEVAVDMWRAFGDIYDATAGKYAE